MVNRLYHFLEVVGIVEMQNVPHREKYSYVQRQVNIDAIPEYTATVIGESVKMVEYNLPQVDEDVSFFTGSEDGVDHFLLEPGCTKILVDDGLVFDTFDINNCFNVNKFSFAADYDQMMIDSDALDLTYDLEEKKLESLGGYLQGVEEVFQKQHGLQDKHEDCIFQSRHKDGLSDSPTQTVLKLDNEPCKESCLESVGYDSFYSGFNERECVAKTVNLSSASTSVLECAYDQSHHLQDQMAVQEMHEAFGSISGYETLVTDKHWLKQHILCGLQNHTDLNNGLNLLDCGVTYNQNAGSNLFSSSVESPRSASCSFIGVPDDKNVPGGECMRRKLSSCDSMTTSSSEVSGIRSDSLDRGDMEDTIVAQKRLRKPTKRYIQESLEHDSRCNIRKCGVSFKSSRDKVLQVKSHKQPCQKGLRAAQPVHQEETFEVTCIQVPFGLPIEEENFKKNMSSSGDDSEDCKDNELSVSCENCETDSFPVESQDDNSQGGYAKRSSTLKSVKPRKNHKSWTPTEVMKLLEGVSIYGVGRWTEIKRLLFPSSTHRTSVDLKDKWRNLLKASCTQMQSNREIEQGRRPAHQVPKHIISRVRELAAAYPYPKEAKSKGLCTTPGVSSFPATSNLIPLQTGVEG